MALRKLPVKPDMLSGQLNANTVPDFTSPQHRSTVGVLCQEDTVEAQREGRGGGSRGLGKPLEQSLLPHVGASSQGMKMRPTHEPLGNTSQTPL